MKIAKTFEEAWAAKEAEGFRYGADALEQVRLGWEMRGAQVATLLFQRDRSLDILRRALAELMSARAGAITESVMEWASRQLTALNHFEEDVRPPPARGPAAEPKADAPSLPADHLLPQRLTAARAFLRRALNELASGIITRSAVDWASMLLSELNSSEENEANLERRSRGGKEGVEGPCEGGSGSRPMLKEESPIPHSMFARLLERVSKLEYLHVWMDRDTSKEEDAFYEGVLKAVLAQGEAYRAGKELPKEGGRLPGSERFDGGL